MTNENQIITMSEAKRRFRLAYPLYRDKREPMPEGVVLRRHGDEVEYVPLKWEESGKRRMRRTQRVSLGPRATRFKTWARDEYANAKVPLAPKLASIVGGAVSTDPAYLARRAAEKANRAARFRSNAMNRGMKKAKSAAAPPKPSKKELAAVAEATANKKGR